MQDGSISIWDPKCIIEKYGEDNVNLGCICHEKELFESSVTALESNPFKPYLIATGGGSEVLILNIEKNIAEPQIFSPGENNLHEENSISAISWNRKIQHILASASLNGLTVIWDLKVNKAIFNFKDSSILYNRNVGLSWNPEIPTQIAVTFDDEKNSELQIWDLRNPQGPVMLFGQGHNNGISSVDWCTNDSSLVLTGKIRKIYF